MKTRLILFLTFISINCFSQTVDNFQLYPNPCVDHIRFQFKLNLEDSISLTTVDLTGKINNKFFSKDLLKAGTYKIDYTANSLKAGIYIAILEGRDKKLISRFVKTGNLDSSKLIDLTKITFIDSVKIYDTIKVKVYDTIKVVVCDTVKVLIIDTLNCNDTKTSIANSKRIPISKSIIFHNNLNVDSFEVDYFELYDLSGKFHMKVKVISDIVSLPDLKTGVYIGLFYKNKVLQNSIKLIKE